MIPLNYLTRIEGIGNAAFEIIQLHAFDHGKVRTESTEPVSPFNGTHSDQVGLSSGAVTL
jgi:hypothetical protein